MKPPPHLPADSSRRSLQQAFPVIDGPDRGDRVAKSHDSFDTLTVSSPHLSTAPSVRTRYFLRRHAELGLVWTCESADELADPYQD